MILFSTRLNSYEKTLKKLEWLVDKLSTTEEPKISEIFNLLDLHKSVAALQFPALLLRSLETDQTYDFIRTDEQFIKLVNRLEQLI